MAKISATQKAVLAIRSVISEIIDNDHKQRVFAAKMVSDIRNAAQDAGLSWDEKTVTPLLKEATAAFYGVPLTEGQRKAKGQLVLDSTHEGYERARKMFQRLVALCFPKPESESVGKAKAEPQAEYEVPEEVAALAAKLVACCNEYDVSAAEMKRWAASAVAAAFAATK